MLVIDGETGADSGCARARGVRRALQGHVVSQPIRIDLCRVEQPRKRNSLTGVANGVGRTALCRAADQRGRPMIAVIKRAVLPLAITLASASAPACAAGSPFGVWIDHTGRGAVEISDCNGKLCGRLVWFKDPNNAKDGCNF